MNTKEILQYAHDNLAPKGLHWNSFICNIIFDLKYSGAITIDQTEDVYIFLKENRPKSDLNIEFFNYKHFNKEEIEMPNAWWIINEINAPEVIKEKKRFLEFLINKL